MWLDVTIKALHLSVSLKIACANMLGAGVLG